MIPNNQTNQNLGYYPYAYNTPQYKMPVESYPQYQAGYFLKGRPVASLEEARAAQIDFDGSLHVFTDIGNKKIYTKQINLDGTATLLTYALVPEITKTEDTEFVTKAEFNQALSQIQALLTRKEEEKKPQSLNNF